MQIACPSCSTTYQIAATVIGANGRSVRCARCQNVWHVPSPGVIPATIDSAAPETAKAGAGAEARFDDRPPAPPPEPPAAPANATSAAQPPDGVAVPPAGTSVEVPSPEDAASEPAEAQHIALSDISIPVTDAPPLAPEPGDGIAGTALDHSAEDIERVAERRRMRAAKRRKAGRRVSMPLVILFLLFLSGALIGLRKDIVRHVPQMASFYSTIGLPVNLRGLVFQDVKISNETHDGVPVLVVEGAVVSTVGVPVDVPRIRFALRNASGAEVYSWTAQPSQPVLEPGETLPFRSRLASPPADGQDLQVRFFTKRDAAGSAR